MKLDGLHLAHSRTTRNADDVFYSSDGDTIYKNTAAGMRSSLNFENSAMIPASSTNLVSNIVVRDASGNFSAGVIDANGEALSSLNASNLASGTVSSDRLSLNASDIPSLNASKITTGSFGTDRIPSLNADKITSGSFGTDRIPSLNADKITSGSFDTARIPSLGAGKITSGSFDTARIPDLGAGKITSGSFDTARIPDLGAGKITSGSFGTARIPNLDAGKITSGSFGTARIPNLDAGKITSGSFDSARIPELGAGKITSGTIGRPIDTTDGNFSGKVGIGTSSPETKLHVHGDSGTFYGDPWNSQHAFVMNITGGPTNGSGNPGSTSYYHNYFYFDVGIYANKSILSGDWIGSFNGVISSSDKRIKKNIVDADDAECLETLRLLKPKKYQYRDVFNRGEEPVWGFIAQDVRETLPHSTQLRREVLPNIYELANVSQSNVITFTNFNTSNLESNATTLIRTTGIDDEDHDIHLVEVIDEHTIRVEEDLTEWIGSVDETGNVVAGNQLFVRGQQVDDFVYLKKESIFTVATAALREVDKQQQADKARIAELETQLASVLMRVTTLENM